MDVRFFVGGDGCSDAEALPCGDGYADCGGKQLEMIRRCAGYDFAFFCDDDTYVVPERLVACGYEAHDYMGCPCHIAEHDCPMAQGGAGFFLSRRAMEAALAAADLPDTPYSDRLVGLLMKGAGVRLHGDFRFNLGKYAGDRGFCNLTPNRLNPYVTTHFVTPELADRVHAHFHKGTPPEPNSYTMVIGGRRVDFCERGGRWWYGVWGGGAFRGEFALAQEAEMTAFRELGS